MYNAGTSAEIYTDCSCGKHHHPGPVVAARLLQVTFIMGAVLKSTDLLMEIETLQEVGRLGVLVRQSTAHCYVPFGR